MHTERAQRRQTAIVRCMSRCLGTLPHIESTFPKHVDDVAVLWYLRSWCILAQRAASQTCCGPILVGQRQGYKLSGRMVVRGAAALHCTELSTSWRSCAH